MKSIFVIQDTEKQAMGATFEEPVASSGIEVTIESGPIGKEYLPRISKK